MALFAPSDEIVELVLGPLVRSWEPRSLADVDKEVSGHIKVLRPLLLMGVTFILAVWIAALVSRQIGHALAVLGAGLGSLTVMWLGIMKFENSVYKSRRLGIFERGMRFGKCIVPFEDLKVISFGAPKTFAEKHMPTLEGYSGSRVPEAKERAKLGRMASLTIQMNDGRRFVWIAVGAIFGKVSYVEFLSLLDERAHAQLRGLNLTDDERREFEAL